MHIKGAISIAVLAAATALSGPASAATLASATTALNIRSGPGPQYSVIGAVNQNGRVQMLGCIQGSLWCQIDYHGRQGWAYSSYLSTLTAGRPMVIAGNTVQIGVPPVTYQAPVTTTVETVGEAAPPISGTLVESPATTTTQYVVNPPPTVRTYVVGHPAQPVYLNGEVVVGAGLPPEVALQPVPDTDYEYAYVNSQPVLVQPQTRRIVYVYR